MVVEAGHVWIELRQFMCKHKNYPASEHLRLVSICTLLETADTHSKMISTVLCCLVMTQNWLVGNLLMSVENVIGLIPFVPAPVG